MRPRVALPSLLAALLLVSLGCAGPEGPRLRQIPPDHDGDYVLWFNDDQPKERGSALAGRRHGEIERYHPDGSLAFRADFVSGVPVGRVEQHYPRGGLQVLEQRDETGALQGEREEYWPDGALKLRSRFRDGRRDGLEEGWHRNGALALRRHWREGQGAGRWEEYDPNGRLLRTEHRWLADGEEVGYLETVWAGPERVSVQTLMRRRDETWTGWQTLWHENGAQAGYVEYEDGKRHGVDRSWSPGGRLVIEGWRVDDQRHGVWRTWSEDGRLMEEIEYSLGEVVDGAGSAADPDADG